MVEHENEALRDRVHDLERRVHDQNDEITCLRATLADALRRINALEAGKGGFSVTKRIFIMTECYCNFYFLNFLARHCQSDQGLNIFPNNLGEKTLWRFFKNLNRY